MGYAKKYIVAIISGLLIAFICFVLTNTYRPYIYANHINDFHFADTITNWLALPAGTLFFWGLHKGRYSFKKEILYAIGGLIIYEFIGLTFDWYDIIATILSGGITFLFYFTYKYFQNKNRNLYFLFHN
ncbi:hypothetical protein FACS1894162_0250 [Bacteroidia bacterium]|nr:hypothetical protein FACS1894162_0250 [Bacteroidia bacterium]